MNLYVARAMKRLTQWDLAKMTGISQAQISLYERGYRNPSDEAKSKIAGALGFNPNEISWSNN